MEASHRTWLCRAARAVKDEPGCSHIDMNGPVVKNGLEQMARNGANESESAELTTVASRQLEG
eukprot:4009645-Amphidinium_carterae.1